MLPQDSVPLPPQDEDCLFLDVYTPYGFDASRGWNRSATLPVIVWIHGGGRISGYKNGTVNPIGLLQQGNNDIIFVALNYRVCTRAFGSHASCLPTATDLVL